MKTILILALAAFLGTGCSKDSGSPRRVTPSPDASGSPVVSVLPGASDPDAASGIKGSPGAKRGSDKLSGGTSESGSDSEDAVRDIVSEFARARLEGNTEYARAFLSAEGRNSYGKGKLSLSGDWERFLIRDVRAADANSFEVDLLLYPAGGSGPDIETLFVGPGEGAPWIIRGAVPA